MKKLAVYLCLALLGSITVDAAVIVFDGFGTDKYNGVPITGADWQQKYDATNVPPFSLQRDLITASNGVAILETTVAMRAYDAPNQTGFTVGSEEIYIVADVQYDYEGGGSISGSGVNEGVFGLNFSTSSNWWAGAKTGNTMCNRGNAIGNRITVPNWTEGWTLHANVGVNTANPDTSDWFKIAHKLISSNSTVWIQTLYYTIDDVTLTSPIQAGVIVDTGVSNNVTIYPGFTTGWNQVGWTNVASFSKMTEVRFDNFYVGTQDEYEPTLAREKGFADFFVWATTLRDFWHPHTLYGHAGTEPINKTGYWFQTTNSAYADPQDKFMQHRPGLMDDPATTNNLEGGLPWRGQCMAAHPARKLVTNETYEVSFEYKLFANGLENSVFMDMFFTTNNASTNAPLDLYSSGDELGFRLVQNMWSNSPETTNGNFQVGFDATTNTTQMWIPLPDLGLTIVDQGSGTDLEGDDLFVTYTAMKTTITPVFDCKLVISNELTGASYNSGSIQITNATAYAASNLYLCFYTSWDLSNSTSNDTNTAGYEIDDVNGRILFYNPAALVGWPLFVDKYLLTGIKTFDFDGDGVNDYGEYVFGGNPTNASDSGTQPWINSSGDYIVALRADNTITANVLTNLSLIFGPWGTDATINVASTNGMNPVTPPVLDNYTNNVSGVAAELFIKLEVE